MDESFCALLGKKVCEKNTKKYFGRLSDILVNKGTSEVLGIVSKNEALIYPKRFFNICDIYSWDETTLYVSGFGEKFMRVIPCNCEFGSIESDMYKRKVVFSDGKEAGKIQDISIDLDTGIITGFEIGFSIVQDLLNGRKLCRTQNTIIYSGESIVIENNLTDVKKRKIFQ